MRNRVFLVVVMTGAFNSVAIPVADAYVDPGSGSFIMQLAVGGLLSAAVAVKLSWRHLMERFKRRDKPPPRRDA